ncbi:MAG: ABC transporter permease, partial [Endozoicomonas sp.]
MKPVLLWSDLLLFVLVLAMACFLFNLLGNRQNRERWSRVFQTRLGISTFLVIITYVAIALLDSLHFRQALPPVAGQNQTYYANDVNSVLDRILGEMSSNVERTYSAPFSLKSYAKTFMENDQGETVR